MERAERSALALAPCSRGAPSSMKKLILWDIDGTIIVSQGAGARAMEKALTKRFGITVDLSTIDWAGRTDAWITGEVFRYVGLPDTPQNSHDYLETYLELLPQELASGPQGRVLPGVLELLETLHHHGGDIAHKGRVDVSGDMTRHDEERLVQLISNHAHYTGSTRAIRWYSSTTRFTRSTCSSISCR